MSVHEGERERESVEVGGVFKVWHRDMANLRFDDSTAVKETERSRMVGIGHWDVEK